MKPILQRTCSIYPPVPTGKWGIVRTYDVLTDHERKDPHSNNSERRLALDIWLPISHPIQLVQYDQKALTFWRHANFWSDSQKAILDRELEKFGEYLSIGGALPKELHSLPVVLFSHGFGAWATFYTYIIEEIVSHGIAVVGINHTYNAAIADFPDETINGKMSHSDLFKSRFADQEQILWLQDLESVIEKIKMGPLPYKLMDPDKMVVMGQSLGGSTAVHACTKMSHLKGCINLDGAVFGQNLSLEVLSPLLILLGGDSLKSMHGLKVVENLANKLGITIEQADDFRECYLTRIDLLSQNNPSVSKIVLPGVDHLGFTDFVFLSQSELFKGVPIGHKDGILMVKGIRKHVMNFLKRNFQSSV